MDLSRATSILSEDIVASLQSIGLLQEVPFGNGQSQFVLYAPSDLMAELVAKYKYDGHVIDPGMYLNIFQKLPFLRAHFVISIFSFFFFFFPLLSSR